MNMVYKIYKEINHGNIINEKNFKNLPKLSNKT